MCFFFKEGGVERASLLRASRDQRGAPSMEREKANGLIRSSSLPLSLLPLSYLLRQVSLLQVQPCGLVAEHADLVVEQARAAGDVVGAHRSELGGQAVVGGLAGVLGVDLAAAEDLGLHVRCGHGAFLGEAEWLRREEKKKKFSSFSFL